MSTQTIFQSLVVTHLIGFLLFAGGTIADFIGIRQFWKQYALDTAKAPAVMQAMSPFAVFMRIGIGVIILSGIGIMAMTHGVFGEQIWFRIKFGLVLLVIANTLLVGQRQRVQLKKALTTDTAIPEKIKVNLNRFHLVQLVCIFIIILLSVFKFN
ncbi:hypothetical protein ACTJJ0_06480 [Chitinophaga sp. 22321]|uniref:Copper resistance protein D n=1 Tax=Chitinophaga hostae TaxID=2831022 RepID=A0ABS5IYQ3_9BACT|nr:hypothetical protein [Chitinophaga hostae]MBS0028094.1 hypothetical protein [Chitinophaga hostae]